MIESLEKLLEAFKKMAEAASYKIDEILSENESRDTWLINRDTRVKSQVIDNKPRLVRKIIR